MSFARVKVAVNFVVSSPDGTRKLSLVGTYSMYRGISSRAMSMSTAVSRVSLNGLVRPLQRERRAVDPRRKGWLDVVFQQIVEVRQEWNGDIDFRHRMAGMLGAVVEFQPAVDELDIVQRKAWRFRFLFLFLGRLRGGRELLQQVREVVGRAVVVAHDVNIGIRESNLSQDGPRR